MAGLGNLADPGMMPAAEMSDSRSGPQGPLRLPDPSPIDGFDLPYEDLETASIPLRCFRFHDGLIDSHRTVVCIPGMSATGQSFARFRPLAGEADFRLLSSPVDSYPGGSLEPFANAVAEVVRRFDRPVLLGTSFGSVVAIRVATSHSVDLSGLILTAGFARHSGLFHPLLPLARFLPRLEPIGSAIAPLIAPLSARYVIGKSSDSEGRQELVREALMTSVEERASRLLAIAEVDLRDQLPAIRVPTLVIHGTADRLVPLQQGRELADLIPNAEYHEIDGAGHIPYISHPKEHNRIIEEFLLGVWQNPGPSR